MSNGISGAWSVWVRPKQTQTRRDVEPRRDSNETGLVDIDQVEPPRLPAEEANEATAGRQGGVITSVTITDNKRDIQG